MLAAIEQCNRVNGRRTVDPLTHHFSTTSPEYYFPIYRYLLAMMSVTGQDSCNADRPSFKKGLLEGLRRDSFETSLAKELNELSLAEREKAYYDLHGVAGVVEERSAFIAKCLTDLESEICKLEVNKKKAYEMAKKADPEYICGRGFRLMFLRAERFMPKNAANRLVGFLEEKLKLFGPKPLARELLLSDLNQDDMVLLRSGLFSIVPLRDSAGRVVTSTIPFFRGESTLKIRMRASMYALCVLAQDEETQRKGCVGVFMNMNPFRWPVEPAYTFKLVNLMGNLGPIRYVGYHFCIDDLQEQSTISNLENIVASAQQFARMRFRFHSGSLMDIHYFLMTFGIPAKVLPVTDQGEAVWQHHYDWISSRKSIEARKLEAKEEEQPTPFLGKTNKDDCVDVPRTIDVLMGREKLAQSHTGNSRYRDLIDEFQSRYDMSETSIEKTILASAIIMKVNEYGGRFLLRKKGETNWSEADDWVAREKVTNAFRGKRKSAVARFKRINDGIETSKRRLPDVSQSYPASKDLFPNFEDGFPKRVAANDFDAF